MVDMSLNLIGLIFSVLILAKAAGILVKSLTNIAAHKNWSEFTVSTLLAVGTTFPELIVGVTAALDNQPNLSLGNIIGSNIVNVTLISGLIAFAGAGVSFKIRKHQEDALFAAGLSLAPLILIIDQTLSRFDGVILIVLFTTYVRRLYQERKVGRHSLTKPKRPLGDHVVIFAFGLLMLLASSRVLVTTAENTALSLGMPLVFIGLFVVALGTSLPELFFGIKAALKHKGEMALGDILGSIVINSGFILGLTAIISPIQVSSPIVVLTSSLFLVVAIALFTYFLRTGYRISRKEGLALVALFAIFAAVEFSLKIF